MLDAIIILVRYASHRGNVALHPTNSVLCLQALLVGLASG